MRATTIVTIALMVLALTFTANAKRSCDLAVAGGCVKTMGSSGWIEFCPENGEDSTTNEPSPDCVSFRPFGWYEVDSDGKAVHFINNLKPTTSGNPANLTFPQLCTGDILVCANNTDDKPLSYTEITLAADIGVSKGKATANNGKLAINIQIFHENGTVTFGDSTKSVVQGSYKFNVLVTDYTFQPTGVKASFDIVVKNKNKDSNDITATNASIDNGAIVNFPQFVHRATSTANREWKNIDVQLVTKSNQKVVSYNFEGPFVSAFYDPLIGGGDDGSSNLTSGASAAAVGFAAVVAAILALLL